MRRATSLHRRLAVVDSRSRHRQRRRCRVGNSRRRRGSAEPARSARSIRRDAPSATSHRRRTSAAELVVRRPLRRRRRRGRRGRLRRPRRSLRPRGRTRLVRAACARTLGVRRRRTAARRSRSGRAPRSRAASSTTRSFEAPDLGERRHRSRPAAPTRRTCPGHSRTPSTIALGRHAFGDARRSGTCGSRLRAGETVLTQVGLEQGATARPRSAPSAFDVDAAGTVVRPRSGDIVDSCAGARARGRRLAYRSRSPGRSRTSPSRSDGSIYVLETTHASPDATHSSGGSTTQVVSSRRSRRQSERRRRSGWAGRPARARASLPPLDARVGRRCARLTPTAQLRRGRAGRSLRSGGEIVVFRHANELRVALISRAEHDSVVAAHERARRSARCSSRSRSGSASSSWSVCTTTTPTSSLVLVLDRQGSRGSIRRSTRPTGRRRLHSSRFRLVGTIALPARLDPGRCLRRPLRPGGALMLVSRHAARDRLRPRARPWVGRDRPPRTTRASWPTTATTPHRRRRPYITRDGSAAVALRARHEGYQWGGGCWNDNDRDDSPNDPHEDPAHRRRRRRLLGLHVQGLARGARHVRRGLPSVGAAPDRPRPVYGRGVQGRLGSAERDRLQVSAGQDGRTRERRPHRPRSTPSIRTAPTRSSRRRARRTARTSGHGRTAAARATAASDEPGGAPERDRGSAAALSRRGARARGRLREGLGVSHRRR